MIHATDSCPDGLAYRVNSLNYWIISFIFQEGIA